MVQTESDLDGKYFFYIEEVDVPFSKYAHLHRAHEMFEALCLEYGESADFPNYSYWNKLDDQYWQLFEWGGGGVLEPDKRYRVND
ncbi:MAG: hypothetical protein ACTSU9_01560, partial [Promethearchaeota archaeon]